MKSELADVYDSQVYACMLSAYIEYVFLIGVNTQYGGFSVVLVVPWVYRSVC